MKLLLFFLFSTAAFSKNIELKVETTWKKGESQKYTQSKLVTVLGQSFLLPVENGPALKIHMTASDDLSQLHPTIKKYAAADSILLAAAIYELNGEAETLINAPQMVTAMDEPAIFSHQSSAGQFEFKITPLTALEVSP